MKKLILLCLFAISAKSTRLDEAALEAVFKQTLADPNVDELLKSVLRSLF